MFQSSRPVAGARILVTIAQQRFIIRFNPRAPLPGRASIPTTTRTEDWRFQSSRPVAGARICNQQHAVPIRRVSILAPRCRGAHRYEALVVASQFRGFQSSRPVAGARIPANCQRCAIGDRVSILAPRCRGAHPPARVGCWNTVLVSILAPRCRGAHPKRFLCPLRRSEVSILAPRCRGAHRGLLSEVDMDTWFQSSRPVAGARIITRLSSTARTNLFQSSRPVAGARIIR